MKGTIKKLLREFNMEVLNRETFRDGELTLEYVEGYDYPRYVIYYELEGGGSDVVAELDSRFFDGQMAKTIMEYLMTRQ
jgi:hypothetical protein|tara:strand:- start:49 stop:285 length:237 start_codon:yes stop_codon:yes gene_type:complete